MVMSILNKITDCSYQHTIQPDLVTSDFQFLGAFENTVRRKRFWSDEVIEEVKTWLRVKNSGCTRLMKLMEIM
jgi:hypothetical protein